MALDGREIARKRAEFDAAQQAAQAAAAGGVAPMDEAIRAQMFEGATDPDRIRAVMTGPGGERPAELTTLAYIAFALAGLRLLGLLAIAVFWGFIATFLEGNAAAGIDAAELAAVKLVLVVAGAFAAFSVVPLIAFGVGALRRRRWAWALGLVVFGLDAVLTVVNALSGTGRIGIVWLALDGYVIYALMQTKVRDALWS